MTHDPQNKQILDFGVHGESKIYTDLITISTSYNLLALGRTKYFSLKKAPSDYVKTAKPNKLRFHFY